MIIKPRTFPNHPDYKAACRQTVSLYNAWKDGPTNRYHKIVFEKSAFLDIQRLWREQATGIIANTGALLVIPVDVNGYEYKDPVSFGNLPDKTGFWTVQNNDKAYQGVGPDITSSAEWSKFIPSAMPGVMVIKQIDRKRNLNGRIVHIEAGG